MKHLLVAFWLCLVVAAPSTAQTFGRYVTLKGEPVVSDGDTIRIRGDRIRLWGVDTPESAQKCRREDDSCFSCGTKATDHLKKLIREGGGEIVYCTVTGEVTYGRQIGICYSGDINLNERMVLDGWGLAYDRYTPAMVAAEKRARALRRGLWAGEFVPPEQWRRGDRLAGCEEAEGGG